MKKILKYVPHYDEIVSFPYKENDFITKRIINYYQEYIFGIIECNNYRLRTLDQTIYEYLINIKFNKFSKKYLEELEESNDEIDYYNNLDINLPKLYKKFEVENIEIVSGSRWL